MLYNYVLFGNIYFTIIDVFLRVSFLEIIIEVSIIFFTHDKPKCDEDVENNNYHEI